jgi:hypothetical protein
MVVINFRYHVVSLTAVFLALAVGLVLGSTVLNGPMLDALESRVNTLGRDNSQLREQVNFLEEEVDREQDFASEAAPMLLDGQLISRRVALVVLPGGEEYVEGVAGALDLAGAAVTGTVTLTEKFTHPQHRQGDLLNLAHQAAPASVDTDALPANSDGVETSAALIAAVLMDGGAAPGPDGAEDPDAEDPDAEDPDAEDPDADGEPGGGQPGPAVPDDERRAVLSAYAAQEYLEHEEILASPAEIVVVVAGLPASENEADERNQAMLTTIEQFAVAGPVVVAGTGVAGDGNVVAEVRGDPELSAAVSTVDNASTPQGQTATGLAVAGHLAGTVGHYGIGDGADRLLPDRSSQ